MVTPPFWPTLMFFSRAVPLLGFSASLAFVRATVALTSIARTITAPILLLSLVQCGFGGGFFPNFAIFVLVSDHLWNFSFYSWASLLVLPFFAPPAYSPLSLS